MCFRVNVWKPMVLRMTEAIALPNLVARRVNEMLFDI